MTSSVSYRALRRQQAIARQVKEAAAWVWNPKLLPIWAYPGELAIPARGTARRIEPMHFWSPE